MIQELGEKQKLSTKPSGPSWRAKGGKIQQLGEPLKLNTRPVGYADASGRSAGKIQNPDRSVSLSTRAVQPYEDRGAAPAGQWVSGRGKGRK